MTHKHIIKNSITEQITESNFSNEEILQYELQKQKYQEELSIRISALNKLKELGLTEEEVKAIIGI